MERSSVLDKVKAFLKQAEQDDPAPVPLEVVGEGPYVEMELGLGVYDVQDASSIKVDSVGVLVPELLEQEVEDSPAPLIEEIKSSK
jgi:hypothetical protein